MAYISDERRKVTTHRLLEMKQRGEKISMLTSYDYTMASLVDRAGVDIILVGEHFRKAAHSLAIDAICCKDNSEAADYLTQSHISNTTILLKGSRGIALEKLIDCL
jgi:UDP-N-acetylmuramyl pentapeptide synthase